MVNKLLLLQVPLINTTPHHLLKDGQLVRFRGMIQDMYNPVYYLATYEVLDTTTNQKIVRSGKYKDSLQCAEHEKVLFESDLTVNQERRPVYCISVPAVNDWALNGEDARSYCTHTMNLPRIWLPWCGIGRRKKRNRNFIILLFTECFFYFYYCSIVDGQHCRVVSQKYCLNLLLQCKKTDPRPDQIQGPRCAAGGVKRNVEDTNDTPDESPKVGSNEEQSKRLCSSRSETAVVGGTGMAMDTSSVEQTMDLNLPIPDSQAEACLINFYDVEEGQLQINAVIEVAGFLSYDVALVTSAVDGLDEPLPPPSLVPRLHAVAQRPVHFSNPLLTSQITVGTYMKVKISLVAEKLQPICPDEVVANVPRLRDELKLVLTQLLLGDALAADYLICHLISRIYLRQDMLVLGKFSLNLSNIPDRRTAADYTFRLYQLLYLRQDMLVLGKFSLNLSNIPDRSTAADYTSRLYQLLCPTFLIVALQLITHLGSTSCCRLCCSVWNYRCYVCRYLRQDMLVLGKFSLNLSNIPDRSTAADYTSRLYQLLQTLLSKSHYLPITLDNMNNINMIPKKNYETNRLESGLLQLSDKTHLVIDETMLEPGQLNDRGVRNCRALGSVISNQRLEYDFQFYPVEFNTDIPVLILSEGKSMLPVSYSLCIDTLLAIYCY
ncbi:mini-chromosome maintenance complex-binding protein-like [Homalodisca vitripennis]|uniref:mini-chromosome maintenance complex-binding protein-like n=1 Tax=Homalodisca vitripennis TaxID=197043 RepID=UPI001EEC9208|nr:mini-chromosome maintenance complex-binding protein-like [Homalodisca vitripennis]